LQHLPEIYKFTSVPRRYRWLSYDYVQFPFLILNNNIIMWWYLRAPTDGIDILLGCQTIKSKSTFESINSSCYLLTCYLGTMTYFLNSITALNNSLLFGLLCGVTRTEVHAHTAIPMFRVKYTRVPNQKVFHPKPRRNNAVGTRWYDCRSDELFRIHSEGNK